MVANQASKSGWAAPVVSMTPGSPVGDALGLLNGLQSATGLFELGKKTRVVVSRVWAGAGGSALWRRVNLPPGALEWPVDRLAAILAHELVHVRQGIMLLGSMDTEREAYIVQCRVEMELLLRQQPVPRNGVRRREADLKALERSPESAKKWILAKGPYYAQFPDAQPQWWQVRRWWPQVRYALKTTWGNRGGGGAG
jgi:hypothetical protein